MLTAAIARHLHTAGLGVFGVAGADLFLEELPTAPVNATSIGFKTAPVGDYSDHRLSGIQVVVRRDKTLGKARPGYEKAIAVRDALHGLRHVTLAAGTPDEVRLVWLRVDGDEPVNLGDDANGQPRWSLRFLAQTTHDTALTIL